MGGEFISFFEAEALFVILFILASASNDFFVHSFLGLFSFFSLLRPKNNELKEIVTQDINNLLCNAFYCISLSFYFEGVTRLLMKNLSQHPLSFIKCCD